MKVREQHKALFAQHLRHGLGIVSHEELIEEMEQREALSAQHQSNGLGIDFWIEQPMRHARHA